MWRLQLDNEGFNNSIKKEKLLQRNSSLAAAVKTIRTWDLRLQYYDNKTKNEYIIPTVKNIHKDMNYWCTPICTHRYMKHLHINIIYNNNIYVHKTESISC